MDEGTVLGGACSCGRNHYFIQVPSNPEETLQVLYDDKAEHSMLLRLDIGQSAYSQSSFSPRSTSSNPQYHLRFLPR